MKIVKLYATTNRQHICPECKGLLHSGDIVNNTDKKHYHMYCAKIRRLNSGVMWWIKRNFI